MALAPGLNILMFEAAPLLSTETSSFIALPLVGTMPTWNTDLNPAGLASFPSRTRKPIVPLVGVVAPK